MPSNPEIGVLHYKENYYAFSSKTAAEEFAQEPDLYVLLQKFLFCTSTVKIKLVGSWYDGACL